MNTEHAGNPAPGEQLWAARDTQAGRAAIIERCDCMPLRDAARWLGVEVCQLHEFLWPGIDPAPLAAVRGDRQATVDLMWAYRRAGWGGADIARAAGMSRQRVGALMKTPPQNRPLVAAKPPKNLQRRPAPNYRLLRSLPDYELAELDAIAGEYHAAPSPQTFERLTAAAHRLHTDFRVRLDHISSRCRVPLPEHRVSDAAA